MLRFLSGTGTNATQQMGVLQRPGKPGSFTKLFSTTAWIYTRDLRMPSMSGTSALPARTKPSLRILSSKVGFSTW